MIPFGAYNVTLVHRNVYKDVADRSSIRYSIHLLTGCSWKTAVNAKGDNGAHRETPAISCRIPYNQFKPSIGDIIIFGEYLDRVSSSSDFNKILEVHPNNSFKVASVADNTLSGVLPHYLARSE